MRAQAAVKLFATHPDLIFVLAGNGKAGEEQDGSTEAERMAEILRNAGVPDKQIRLEKQSVDTDGNVVLTSVRYLIRMKPGLLIVVTSPFHMARAVQLFRHILDSSWVVAEWPSKVSEGDERKTEWSSVFFAGTPQGDLQSAVARLLEQGKPRYREVRILRDFMKKAS